MRSGGDRGHRPEGLLGDLGRSGNGGFSLFLDPGQHDLDADEALSLTRTRKNLPTDPQGDPCPPIDDLDRAEFQQDVLSGIRGRMTSVTRLPYNFIKGPIIGWNAPKAFVSSMGMLTMPQFVLSAALGFSSKSEVLEARRAGAFREPHRLPGGVHPRGEAVPRPRPAADAGLLAAGLSRIPTRPWSRRFPWSRRWRPSSSPASSPSPPSFDGFPSEESDALALALRA